jgi:hypothetical protein
MWIGSVRPGGGVSAASLACSLHRMAPTNARFCWRAHMDRLEDETAKAARQVCGAALKVKGTSARFTTPRGLAPAGHDGSGQLAIKHRRQSCNCPGMQPIVAPPPLQRMVLDVVLTAFADSPEASRAPAWGRAKRG